LFVPTNPPALPNGLPDRLALIIQGICRVLTARCIEDLSVAPLMHLAWMRLHRLSARFAALVFAVRAGRLASAPLGSSTMAGTRRRADPAPAFSEPPDFPQEYVLPRGFGWLLELAPDAASYSGQVEQLLEDPEMVALLAHAPEAAGRILRPLFRMLGIPLPPALHLSRRKRSHKLPLPPAPLPLAVGRRTPSIPRLSRRQPGLLPMRELIRRWSRLCRPERGRLGAR
jgi:hypothetical protein